MPGKAGRSGPPMNLNAVKRPWRVFWRRRAVGPADRWILPALESYAEGLVNQKGGEDGVQDGQRHLIEIAQTARGCWMLILAEAGRKGFVIDTEKAWDLSPGVKELPKFLGLERSALSDLGVEERDTKQVEPIVVKRWSDLPANGSEMTNEEIATPTDGTP